MRDFAVLLLLGVLPALSIVSIASANDYQFHHGLTKSQLQKIFQVDEHGKVPEYDIFNLHSRVRRSTDGKLTRTVHINAFGTKKILNLVPNTELASSVPLFYADSHEKGPGGVILTPLPQNDDIGVPYQDEESMAAVMVKNGLDGGAILMDGTIGEDLVIRSLPHSLHSLLPFHKNRRTSPREDELSENALEDAEPQEPPHLGEDEDLVFSDGLPLVADDEFVTGSSVLPSNESSSPNKTLTNLPEGLELLRKRREISESFHVIYKRTAPSIDTDYVLMELDKIPTKNPNARLRKKREAPYVIYPEILVLVDYDGYLLHGEDNSQIKSYYVSFWNGVDLRYKLLKSPRVKVSIAGIIISRSRDAMPYLERNRVGREAIDSAAALTDMGKYLYQERRLPTYDIAVAITKYDLCRRRKSGNCTTGTADLTCVDELIVRANVTRGLQFSLESQWVDGGFAYVGGACVVNKRLEKVNSVAIVEDTGGFSGIIVAAHEVGHLLGAVHDGSPPPSYLGGPGARRCKWKDGFIMSDLRHTERGFRWSPCSVEQFNHFLNGETATCLYNLPHEDESLPRVLPGKLMSLDSQCRKDRGTSACFKDDRVCAQLFCFDSASGFCVSYRPAAEGSPCGNGKMCLNGKCSYDNENSISDIDIHSPNDNFIDDSDRDLNVAATVMAVTTTSSATIRPFFSTTSRSVWRDKSKNNNTDRWNTNNIITTTSTSPPTTKRRTTTRRPTTTRSTTPRTTSTTTTPTTTSTTTTIPTTTTTISTTTTTPSTTTPPPTTTTSTTSSSNTTNPTTTRASSTKKLSTTKRSNWWKDNNIDSNWNKKKFSRITTYEPLKPTTPTRTKRTTITTTSSPSPTTTYVTTTTEKRVANNSHSRLKSKDLKTVNIFSNNDSNFCEDEISKIAGKLTCKEFLENYGVRYCNHRYIEKNCCRTKLEMCP